MNWYYVDQGQQAGPVNDAQLEELRRTGKVQPDTFIWREGMADWAPYQEARSGIQSSGAATATAVAESDTAEAVCAECGGIFPVDEMIRHGNVRVCAQCKPVFMQKLAEGAKIEASTLNYAGFWIRFAAYFLDLIILYAVNLSLGLIFGLSLRQIVGVDPTAALTLQLTLSGIGLLIGLSYEVILIGKYGATLGKMVCKLKVVTPDGGRVSYTRSLGRYFGKMLSGMICLIGYLMAGFDGQKRALHDHLCGTRVIYNY